MTRTPCSACRIAAWTELAEMVEDAARELDRQASARQADEAATLKAIKAGTAPSPVPANLWEARRTLEHSARIKRVLAADVRAAIAAAVEASKQPAEAAEIAMPTEDQQ